jgi:hypothetical protein
MVSLTHTRENDLIGATGNSWLLAQEVFPVIPCWSSTFFNLYHYSHRAYHHLLRLQNNGPALKDVYTLIPGTCEYVPLHDKRDLEDTERKKLSCNIQLGQSILGEGRWMQ